MIRTGSRATNGRKRSYLVIRYDDYGAAYSSACSARFDVETMLHREMSARGWPWVCGVTPRQSVDPHNVIEERTVPLSEDPARVELLRRAVNGGLCEPAVHGLTHHTWTQLPRYGTEFVGLPEDQQHEIVRTARSEVERIVARSVSVFIPPWNSYDEGTVAAVERAGMTLLSGGLTPFVSVRGAIHMVPSTIELADLERLVERGHRYPAGAVVVLLLHGTDFVTVDQKLGYLRPEEFAWRVERAVEHFDAEVVPVARIPELVGPDLEDRGRRAAAIFDRHERVSALPILGPRLQRCLLPYWAALLPVRDAARARGMLFSALLAWYLAVAAMASIPSWLVRAGLDAGAWRTGSLAMLSLAGAAVTAFCARNALLKRYRGRWGSRRIGFRTWTGLVAGMALALWGIIPWLLSRVGGQL